MDSGIYVLVGIVILAILVISGLYLLLKKAHKWGFNNVKKIKDSYNFSVPVLSLTIFLKFSLDIFYDIFYGESFGDSIFFERVMLLTLFFSMGIHIYKNMNNHPE